MCAETLHLICNGLGTRIPIDRYLPIKGLALFMTTDPTGQGRHNYSDDTLLMAYPSSYQLQISE